MAKSDEPEQGARALTTAQRERLRNWIESKSGGSTSPCPICGTNNWGMGAHLLTGLRLSPGVTSLAAPQYPVALIHCTNCFYVQQFMAVPIGLLDTEESDD